MEKPNKSKCNGSAGAILASGPPYMSSRQRRQLSPHTTSSTKPKAVARVPEISWFISKAEVIRLRDAALYAFCIGRPLNESITVHFEKAAVKSPAAFRSRLLKIMGNWLSRRSGFSVCFVWVLENASPDENNFGGGLHLNLLVHVPRELRKEFRQVFEDRWIELAGGIDRKGVVKYRAFEHSGPAGDIELYLRHGLWGALRYRLKGVGPGFASEFDIVPSDQGAIAGKRLGYSQALGEQHRWRPVTFPKYPGIWTAGQDSRRRRLVSYSCPELLGMPRDEC